MLEHAKYDDGGGGVIATPVAQDATDGSDRRSVAGASLVSWSETLEAHLLYGALVVFVAWIVPAEDLWRSHSGALVGLGFLAVWRYGWGLLHFLRSNIYRFIVFPRMRANADAALRARRSIGGDPHVYFLVTSFRIDGDTTAQVYRAVFEAAKQASGGATVVASIVEMADQRLIRQLHRLICGQASGVRLVITRIEGSGKRDALAYGFRAISHQDPKPDDMVAVIDGDSIIPVDLVSKCAGFFRTDAKVGALTTDERSLVHGDAKFHVWYSLRFAQRHILMSSNGLSRKVLTLTGRMSMFRASIICDPDFVRQVEADYLDHWRFGRLKFLTGDDKSSWFWLLRNGYRMLYVPDVVVATVEEPPSTRFLPAATQLMVRWFGNMLRTNRRALALGPTRIGWFTWWTILDQRISMWTSLAGVAMVLLIGIFETPTAFLVYLLWILVTRYLQTLLLLNSRPRVSAFYPFFIYFNQVYGSLVKTYIFFHLNKQRWTRQKTTLADNRSRLQMFSREFASSALHVGSLLCFITFVALLLGQLPIPEARTFSLVYESNMLK
ncbi:glycosyltransferase family 2 protein (plasmid) [Rhizobium grahamii]|uniref:Glycosyltransferase family 2 protein n=1 Tax=Rhizobium grahamii TaxID=1120045 RepID=A0A5Q0CEC2_9HYPH|nr:MULTISPECIES: glycosyltransferase [Rhizobium]QFY63693.1 glycosyltransferase family 2 protein [Rhizobium grahamii]QRM51543.1 glycosyltransferase family 2 protein [Rhizobium sp. BG6]